MTKNNIVLQISNCRRSQSDEIFVKDTKTNISLLHLVLCEYAENNNCHYPQNLKQIAAWLKKHTHSGGLYKRRYYNNESYTGFVSDPQIAILYKQPLTKDIYLPPEEYAGLILYHPTIENNKVVSFQLSAIGKDGKLIDNRSKPDPFIITETLNDCLKINKKPL